MQPEPLHSIMKPSNPRPMPLRISEAFSGDAIVAETAGEVKPEMENSEMPTPWFKFHSRFLCDARLLDIARETGLVELAVCGAYAVLLDAASRAKPRGKVPESAAAVLARRMGNGTEDSAKPIVEAFRRHGIITRYGHIAGWSDDQIQPEKVEARKARKEAKAERQRAYRAKKAGKPVEAPAPEPKAEPKPEPEPAPKPKTVQLSLDGTPVEKPEPKAKKARAVQGEPQEFTRFYRLYPRRVGRRDALKAWTSVIKSGEDAARAIAYAHRLGRWNDDETESLGFDGEIRYCAHPATALRRGYWENEGDLVSADSGTASERKTFQGMRNEGIRGMCGQLADEMGDAEAIDVEVVYGDVSVGAIAAAPALEAVQPQNTSSFNG